MARDSSAALDRGPRIRCETPKPRMAKAMLVDVTLREKRAEYGRILRRAREIAGMNRDQTADALHVDPAQVSRWESGDENPQTFRYRQHPRLRLAYLEAQAEADGGDDRVQIQTVVTIRRA